MNAQRRVETTGALATAMDVNTASALAHSTAHASPVMPLSPIPILQAHVPPQVHTPQLLAQGKLLRRDRTFLTWKWRDFYLERNRLQYFNEKGTRKGEIVLAPTTPIVIRLQSEPKPYAFVLFIKDEKHTLAAATAADRQKWIDVFRDVFHANIEDFQTTTGSSSVAVKQEKRTRPTFLPIPDISEDEASRPVGGAMTPNAQNGSGRGSFAGRTSEGGGNGPSSNGGVSVNGGDAHEHRVFFRTSESATAIHDHNPRLNALKEQYSNVTFPRSLASGEELVGVGPLVRRMGWTDERILAVALYVDVDAATKELQRYQGRRLKSLYGDQGFYDHLVQAKFRRTFVVTSRKRVSKSVLTALLHDEIAPRIGAATEALETFLGFLEKSLHKAESMVLRINPDGGRFEFRLRGQQYPPIASSLLCQCIQNIFFDVNSIQQDAKRRLIERFPLLWGMDDMDGAVPILDFEKEDSLESSMREEDEEESDEDEDDDDDDDDDGDDADEEDVDSLNIKAHSARKSSREGHKMKRVMSSKEQLDELDEREHELLRRESRTLGVHFGPIVDRESNALFQGDLLVDGSALLGTWSQKMMYMPSDTPDEEEKCVVSVGLYVDPGNASEALLKYKGLSVGSILQDPDFFARFAEGAFTKHLVFKVQNTVPVTKVLDFFTVRIRRRNSNSGFQDPARAQDVKIRAAMEKLSDPSIDALHPKDEMRVAIASDGQMTLSIRRQDENSPSVAVENLKMTSAPMSTLFQGVFYGYHTLDPSCRTQLLERLPNLLDLAKDDLAHTYHDEIQMLKENYKRQLPEFRLKAGYLSIAFEKKKKMMKKNADGVKEPTTKASRWSKRWCRLDGTTFSYFSHKRSKKARDLVDLTECTVVEITSGLNVAGLTPFAAEKAANPRPSIRIGIVKPNGEVLALKTEDVYEGAEWLETLVDASKVQKLAGGAVAADGLGGGVDDEGIIDEGADETPEEGEGSAVRMSTVRSSHGSSADATPEGAFSPYEKHGSLVAWIREDIHHAVIFVLLLIITWLVLLLDPVAEIPITL
ncbi:hypothetical protein Poli38472_002677 [Pythium oligandrum]|uniref:PH domain-containing protein n=1 Tax=Pythium oligandrum TaxID=41045 RepID=A0A8K1FIE4_PYTOL|nr:hypothetical protein Poli38472_002677 [Pythium oligandrum]|eukprot:TMW63736.1 hypothetical protein Poli38472_002677 [Pythium oligandrum]